MTTLNHSGDLPATEPLEIGNHNGIFCDAWAVSHERLVFASLWGRGSRMLALYGLITTGELCWLDLGGRHLPLDKDMDKYQTRMPKHSRYGSDCMHSMIYARITREPQAKQQILLDNRPVSDDRLWTVLNHVSDLGLLPHWQQPLLDALRRNGFIEDMETAGVYAQVLNLGKHDEYEVLVQDMIRSGQLTREAA